MGIIKPNEDSKRKQNFWLQAPHTPIHPTHQSNPHTNSRHTPIYPTHEPLPTSNWPHTWTTPHPLTKFKTKKFSRFFLRIRSYQWAAAVFSVSSPDSQLLLFLFWCAWGGDLLTICQKRYRRLCLFCSFIIQKKKNSGHPDQIIDQRKFFINMEKLMGNDNI